MPPRSFRHLQRTYDFNSEDGTPLPRKTERWHGDQSGFCPRQVRTDFIYIHWNRPLFPGGFDKAQIEKRRCWWNRLAEISPLSKRVGHALVALRADPPIGAKGAKLADEVVIGIGGILAILLRIFHEDINRLILVFG